MSGVLTSFIVVICAFTVSIVVGVFLSLAALIPPIRRFGQRDTVSGRILIVLLTLLAFVMAFGLSTRLFAEAMYRSVSGAIDQVRAIVAVGSREGELIEKWDRSKSGVIVELWLRQVIPPRDDDPGCRTGRFEVCDFMGELGIWGVPSWGMYLLYVGIGVVSALSSGLSVKKIISMKVA